MLTDADFYMKLMWLGVIWVWVVGLSLAATDVRLSIGIPIAVTPAIVGMVGLILFGF